MSMPRVEKGRESKSMMLHRNVTNITRATKRKAATVTFAIDDDLAERLIKNAMVQMNFLRSDWAAVGLMLHWINVDYYEPGEEPVKAAPELEAPALKKTTKKKAKKQTTART